MKFLLSKLSREVYIGIPMPLHIAKSLDIRYQFFYISSEPALTLFQKLNPSISYLPYALPLNIRTLSLSQIPCTTSKPETQNVSLLSAPRIRVRNPWQRTYCTRTREILRPTRTSELCVRRSVKAPGHSYVRSRFIRPRWWLRSHASSDILKKRFENSSASPHPKYADGTD